MLMEIKQAVKVGGINYQRGTRDLSQEILKHEHFQIYQKAGLVVPVKPAERKVLPKVQSPAEKARAVASKVSPPSPGGAGAASAKGK